MTNSSSILVTGAAGFIGAAFTKALLLSRPDAHIVGIDDLNDYYDPALKEYRLSSILEEAKSLSKGSASVNFTFLKGNITDSAFIRSVFEEHRPGIVVHLAAQAGVRKSIDDPDAYIQSNIIGFYNILEACRHAKTPVEHLVYASSSSVYGASKSFPFKESDTATDAPVSLYAATKKSNELMAHAYAKLYDIPATGLRFFTVYGPAGRPDMAYYKFANKLIAGETIDLYNYGDSTRDFTYIDDIVGGILAVCSSPPEKKTGADGLPIPPHAVYNIGSSDPVKLFDFVQILRDSLVREGLLPSDFDLKAHVNLLPMQPGDVPDTCADTSALAKKFGFSPATALSDGLTQFAKWYKEYRE